MSNNHSLPDSRSRFGSQETETAGNDARNGLRRMTLPLSALAFWAAIALPALYLPMLATGLESVRGLGLFLGLFGLHVVSLVAGRSYRR